MSNVNGRGDNDEPILWGVSHLDGITPVQIKFNPSGRGIKIDTTTTIAFTPTVKASVVPNNVKLATATSTSDNSTVYPWVVNASTGAVLIAM